MDEDRIKEYLNYVEKKAKDRRVAIGKKFNSIDFAMGAACILFFIERQDMMPASWVFGPLAGKDPFTMENLDG